MSVESSKWSASAFASTRRNHLIRRTAKPQPALVSRHRRDEHHACTPEKEHNTLVRAYVGVTDNGWYRFLAARPDLAEVNFWQPSGRHEFHVLAPGEPFFFKTHHPHNRVVGGGFFSDSARLKVSEAWELFGEANGAASIE